MKKIEGTCLCGGVTISAKETDAHFVACHCETCRTWTGGPQMAVGCGKDVEVKGEEHVTFFKSSAWAERAFCKRCGTHLFCRVKETSDHRVLLGLFGNSISPKFDMQFFIDKKPSNYTFSEETKAMTEAQIMEYFAPKA